MSFCQKCGSMIEEGGNYCSTCGTKQTINEEAESPQPSKFVSIIAIIGAILIFVGLAWLIAKNWHQIPDIGKVSILVFSTLASFIIGFFLRQNDHEATGRSLITLGALLYILSVFLIAQIYATPTGLQGYAWLLLLCWPIIFITAYFLNSPENLMLSLIIFFPWSTIQYFASISRIGLSIEEGAIFCLIWLFLSAGALLYGLSILHNSLKHRFTNIYRAWTVFYFLLIFYILSFQSILPIIGEYSFDGKAFSIFLILFIILCFLGFIIGALFATSKTSISLKEILGFLGVLVILFILILSTKAGAGLMGRCYEKSCYDFRTSADCASAPDPLNCKWNIDQNSCTLFNCYNFKTESECTSTPAKMQCIWRNNRCDSQGPMLVDPDQKCGLYNNKKSECLDQTACNWSPSRNIRSVSKGLPTSLWLIWIIINIAFIGFIILVLWYGKLVGSTKIINLGLSFFILDIITRYIGFWMDFKGYFAFSILAILGGILLILSSWLIPKWRRRLLEEATQNE